MKLLTKFFMYVLENTDEVSTVWEVYLEELFLDMSQLLTQNCKATLYFSLEVRPNRKGTALSYNL